MNQKQGRIQELAKGDWSIPLPFPSPFSYPSLPSPLEVGPLNLRKRVWCRAVRRRTGGRRRRWVVLWPAAAARRAFFIGGGGVGLWSAAAVSAATETAHSPVRRFFLVLQGSATSPVISAGAEKLTVNMHALHNFTVLMRCSLPNF